ncbi:amino acid ABC transporter substrate-binding protein [Betaproteobacteria bacterium GR16-43]|nr:amino acid ABC transporter substrate-binding protein [Betaproteobacteria bacterium GR16-43]
MLKIVAIVLALACATAAHAQELTGTLKKIKDANAIALGIRDTSVPFSFLNEKQQPVGYSMDLCMRIVDAVKAELNLPTLQVKHIPVISQTRIPLVANGTVDIECGSTTNTLTRQKQAEFSPVTFIGGTRLLVKAKSGIKEVEDLKGKTISVSQGTTNERVIKNLSEKLNLGIKVLNVKDHAEGFLVLESGRVDANVSDDVQLYGLRANARNPADYAVVGRSLSYEPFGLMFKRGDPDFKLLVAKTLAGLMRSGEMEKLHAKWFGPLGLPLDDATKAAFALQALPE